MLILAKPNAIYQHLKQTKKNIISKSVPIFSVQTYSVKKTVYD